MGRKRKKKEKALGISALARQAPAEPVVLGSIPGPRGRVAYAEEAQIYKEVPPVFVEPPYNPFYPTDARTVMAVVYPNHWNFIPNPALRVDDHGWETEGFDFPYAYNVNTTDDGAANLAAIDQISAPPLPEEVGKVLPVDGDVLRLHDNHGENYYMIAEDGYTTSPATSPVPVSGPIVGWKNKTGSFHSLSADSWVGQSIQVNGTGTIRYRDQGHFVYVGIEEEVPEDTYEWNHPARGNDRWRFSAYFKGEGQVRVRMDAYYPQLDGVPYSPPLHSEAVEHTDPPEEWGYNEYEIIYDGNVWIRNDPPFYKSLGVPVAVTLDPTTITPISFMYPLLESEVDLAVWELTDTFVFKGPYYERYGIPALHEAPVEAPAGDKYLRSSLDGTLWELDNGAYRLSSVRSHADPSSAVPDFNSMPEHLWYQDTVYRAITPLPMAAPFYEAVSTPDLIDDPLTAEPGDEYVKAITLRPAEPPLIWSPDDEPVGTVSYEELWQLTPPPYYTNSHSGPSFAQVYTQWEHVDAGENWTRWSVRTGYRDGASASTAVAFTKAAWIDCWIEVKDAKGLLVSSFLLDPNEFPIAEYFDGGMTETPELDDYLWYGEPDNSISLYYYDRIQRMEWTHRNLVLMVPVGRPYQMFLGSEKIPFRLYGDTTPTWNPRIPPPPPPPILEQAIWSVNSDTVRADGLALTDLSGGGKDLVLGTGANKPTILTYDGEAYIYDPGLTSNSIYGSWPTSDITIPATASLEWDVEIGPIEGVYELLTANGVSPGTMTVSVDETRQFRVSSHYGPSQSLSWEGVVPTGRHLYRVDLTPTTATLYIDGVSQGSKTFDQIAPRQDYKGGFSIMDSGSGGYVKCWRFAAGTSYIFEPANVQDQYYERVINTGSGSPGSTWRINRNPYNKRFVLVDRPLVVFEGEHVAQVNNLTTPAAGGGTILVSIRQWRLQNKNNYLFLCPGEPPSTLAYADGSANKFNIAVIADSFSYFHPEIYQTAGATVLGGRLSPGQWDSYLNFWFYDTGAISGNTPPEDASLVVSPLKFGYGTGADSYFELVAAAVWDRALTNDEMDQAAQAMGLIL